MPREIWKPVVGWVGFYEVSSLGRVRSLPRVVAKGSYTYTVKGRILRVTLSRGYPRCTLMRKGEESTAKVHTLVAAAFRGPRPPGHDVRHRDGDKLNCKLVNIRYGTRSQNEGDKIIHGKSNRGERCAAAKLTRKHVLAIRSRYVAGGVSHKKLGEKYGVSANAIYHILNGNTWGWL